MIKRVKIIIEYDGSGYVGWQNQKNGKSVQGEIEKALLELFDKKIKLSGAGRTDSGVHAAGQVAHFDLDGKFTNLDKICKSINYILSKNKNRISILKASYETDNFHSRFSARKKKYVYKILNRSTKSYLYENRAWFIPTKLDLKKMIKASSFFVGKFDFNAFRSTHCQALQSVRSIEKIIIKRSKETIHLKFSGKSFLHNQIRIMVGTLVDVGRGKIEVDKVKEILESRDRTKAGVTAPPHGLYLEKIIY
jgi:tRNA pseudouridine38-40 synthase